MSERLLLVVGSNPPSKTSGQRTRARIEQARVILGYEEVQLVNLFALPTYRSGGVSELGGVPAGWIAARTEIKAAFSSASGILLAYGTQPPTGPARQHFHDQVDWLNERIQALLLPSWWVGGAPRHPSRWQRYTWREFPNMDYLEALGFALGQRSLSRPASSA